MDLFRIQAFLAQAAAQAPVQDDPRAVMMKQLILFAGLGVVFYLLLIRPQQKKAKQQQEMLKTVKPGDKVMTAAGIIGVIVTVKEKTVTIRSADTKLELSKAALSEITERGSQTAES